MITLTDFGNTGLNGVQHKGMINHEGTDKFVKLDDLNPAVSGSWENAFDYRYSSVSESIASCFTRHIQSDVRHADYKFETFDIKGRQTSGTISDIFLNENEVEKVLAVGKYGHMNSVTHFTTDEYAEKIVDAKPDVRVRNMIDIFEQNNVPRDVAKKFLMEQVVVDTVLGNKDRLNNPSNFVIAYNNVTDTAVPVNMDYGRCLQIPTWSDTYEQNYNLNETEWVTEDIENFSNDVLTSNDALIRGYTIQDHLKVLEEHGAEPLVVDIQAVKNDIEELKQVFHGQPFEKFAIMKCDTLLAVLDNEHVNKLIIDTAHVLTDEDVAIETENKGVIR